MSDKKPGFWRRLFGSPTGAPENKEPARKEPVNQEPAKKEPPRQPPAQKEPPERQRPAKKTSKPAAGKEPDTPEARTAPPPGGPAASAGRRHPDERPVGTRKKGSPDDKPPAQGRVAGKPKPRKKAASSSAGAPPPHAPNEPPAEEAPPEEGPEQPEEPSSPTEPEPKEPGEDGEPKDFAGEPKQFASAKDSASAESAPRRSWFAQLRHGLARSSNALNQDLATVLGKRRLDAETLEQLEDVLIKADLGVEMASRIRTKLSQSRYERGLSPEALRELLAAEIGEVLAPVAQPFVLEPGARPHVFLIVGVNGTGKTTTAAKMARQFRQSGRSVLLAAADTFRAAAIDQLKVWGERAGVEVVTRDVGADPAGIAYEALERARAEGTDVLLIDTAGRLQNKADLMAELAKITRVLRKLDSSAPHGVVLVLDATTGQNALSQVATFKEIAGVTSLVVTKLDGTARGGILVAIAERFGIPINAIGVGEGMDDLESFDAASFARAVAGIEPSNAAAA